MTRRLAEGAQREVEQRAEAQRQAEWAADDAAYARAQVLGTEAAYTEYLSSWPQGRHVEEARRLQEEMEEEEQRKAEEERQRQAEEERRKQERQPGYRFQDCPECPEMVVVPAGSFMMGSPSNEKGRFRREGPQHRVEIAEPFAVGIYEVTRGEFARFVDETGYSTGNSCRTQDIIEPTLKNLEPDWQNPGHRQTDRHPVVCVSWDDAQAYVRWLSRKTGERYRLPSESEWEYVARAGRQTAWYWGETESGQCAHANGADASTDLYYITWRADCDDGHARTAPVGTYSKNGFGLHDVLGNVWEWTQDCWGRRYDGAPDDGQPRDRDSCAKRVVRSGGWHNGPAGLRAANRNRTNPGNRADSGGFRITRMLTP